MYALSIRQPWAWLVANGFKDVENRNWPTMHRGPVLIHAAKTMSNAEYADCYDFVKYTFGDRIAFPSLDELKRGGIIGIGEIVDCVTRSPSRWFFGPYGFVIQGTKVLPFHSLRGQLNFFDVEVTWDLQNGC